MNKDWIKMVKAGEEKSVHPGNVENHRRMGWLIVSVDPRREAPAEADLTPNPSLQDAARSPKGEGSEATEAAAAPDAESAPAAEVAATPAEEAAEEPPATDVAAPEVKKTAAPRKPAAPKKPKAEKK